MWIFKPATGTVIAQCNFQAPKSMNDASTDNAIFIPVLQLQSLFLFIVSYMSTLAEHPIARCL